MDVIGSGMEFSMVWVKIDGYSVMFRLNIEIRDVIVDIVDVFDNIKFVLFVVLFVFIMDDLLIIYLLFDVYFGMLLWGEEMGEDYDMLFVLYDMNVVMNKIVVLIFNSYMVLLLIGGDFFYVDDGNVEILVSKYKLDVDGCYDCVIDFGVNLFVNFVDLLLYKYNIVWVKVLWGNYDENVYWILWVVMF